MSSASRRHDDAPIPFRTHGEHDTPAPSLDSWLDVLTTLLPGKAAEREAIREELGAHVRERARDLMLAGRSEAQANREAIDELGDAAQLAARYRKIDHASRRRRLMHVALIAVTASAAGLTGYLALGTNPTGVPHPPAPSAEHYMAEPLAETVVTIAAGSTIGDLASLLRDETGLAVFIHTERLGDFGLEAATQIKTPALGVPLEQAMGLINESLGDPYDKLAIMKTGELLEISMLSHFDERSVELIAYDLSPVLGDVDLDDEAAMGARAEQAEAITSVVTEMVEPDHWADNGGELASLRIAGDTLFVKAPARFHPQVSWIVDRLVADHIGAAAPSAPIDGSLLNAGTTRIRAEDGKIVMLITRPGEQPMMVVSESLVLDHAIAAGGSRGADPFAAPVSNPREPSPVDLNAPPPSPGSPPAAPTPGRRAR